MAVALAVMSCACTVLAQTAHYRVPPPDSEELLPVTDVWVVKEEVDESTGVACHWWKMVMLRPGGAVMGIRVLSANVPMTTTESPGTIIRYQYRPPEGPPLEYVDARTGQALLPELSFHEYFLPRATPGAQGPAGFAYTGRLMGQALQRVTEGLEPPACDFRDPLVIRLDPDLILYACADQKEEPLGANPQKKYQLVPLEEADYRAKIEAGFNAFGLVPAYRSWMVRLPAWVVGQPVFPEDCYRSNFIFHAMYLDEPMVRLGWNGSLSHTPLGPMVMAEALHTRVASQLTLDDLLVRPAGVHTGDMDLLRPACPAWETEFWSAWYQMRSGVTAVVHEGRYRKRGYGWDPEQLLGQGLEGLSDDDQFNFMFAFLRGAARCFDGDWGMSIYAESEERLRVPACLRAYDMGARYLWLWDGPDEYHITHEEQMELARAVRDHARSHPRGPLRELNRRARVGIVLPDGYAFNCDGVWGTNREQLNRFGVRYGDIAAAALAHGILCSRRHVAFDYLIDHPGVELLGYEQLIRIREDGHVVGAEALFDTERAGPLEIILELPGDKAIHVADPPADPRRIPWAGPLIIDGDLSDWKAAEWMALGPEHWFGDSYEFVTRLEVSQTPITARGNRFQGFGFEDLTQENKRRYRQELQPHEFMVVVTAIEPGSPAERAGLRVGDGIIRMGPQRTKYGFQVWQLAEALAKAGPGRELEVHVRRSGDQLPRTQGDLAAEVAFAHDERFLYIAVAVTDDVHLQRIEGPDFWQQDSVQVGIRPMLSGPVEGYGEHDHEIGLALREGVSLVWRWKGRTGQPADMLRTAQAVVVRREDRTFYEAAVPWTELMPAAPAIWDHGAINVVVNDCDGSQPGSPLTGARAFQRKARLEMVPFAMTESKRPGQFTVFRLDAPVTTDTARKDSADISAALFWIRSSMPEKGAAELLCVLHADDRQDAWIEAEVFSPEDPAGHRLSGRERMAMKGGTEQHLLRIRGNLSPGRYILTVRVLDRQERIAAQDRLGVFIYP